MASTNRIRHRPEDLVPRLLMRAVLLLIFAILAIVAFARITDRPLEAQPPRGPIVAEQVIHLWGDTSGAARVTDADGIEIATFAPGEGGFLSTIDRFVRRERARHNADPAGPLHVRMREGNRLALFDPSTGRETELVSFGKDNVAAFASLIQTE
ncbi:MAG: photosynthetic complex assembly protein PuhC [Pseudomonadota bacterium]